MSTSGQPARQPDLFRICATCGRPLDYSAGKGWLHLVDGDDHIAVPVLPGEVPVRGFCDFCHEPDPLMVIPARSFELSGAPPVRIDNNDYVQGSAGDWSACATCASDVDRGRWADLLRRALKSFSSRHDLIVTDDTRRHLARTYRQLRRHITGSSRPMVWPTSPPR